MPLAHELPGLPEMVRAEMHNSQRSWRQWWMGDGYLDDDTIPRGNFLAAAHDLLGGRTWCSCVACKGQCSVTTAQYAQYMLQFNGIHTDCPWRDRAARA